MSTTFLKGFWGMFGFRCSFTTFLGCLQCPEASRVAPADKAFRHAWPTPSMLEQLRTHASQTVPTMF
jgi:hypothetical protein